MYYHWERHVMSSRFMYPILENFWTRSNWFGLLCTVGSIIKRTKEQVLLWESEQSSSQTAEPGDSGWSPHSQMSGQMCFGINDAFERVPNRIISQSVVVPQLLSNISMKYWFRNIFTPKRLTSDKKMVCISPYLLVVVKEHLSAMQCQPKHCRFLSLDLY